MPSRIARSALRLAALGCVADAGGATASLVDELMGMLIRVKLRYAFALGLVPLRRSSGEGTRTDAMLAAVAACTPIAVSSKTRQSLGAMPSRSAPNRKQSGAGLLR